MAESKFSAAELRIVLSAPAVFDRGDVVVESEGRLYARKGSIDATDVCFLRMPSADVVLEKLEALGNAASFSVIWDSKTNVHRLTSFAFGTKRAFTYPDPARPGKQRKVELIDHLSIHGASRDMVIYKLLAKLIAQPLYRRTLRGEQRVVTKIDKKDRVTFSLEKRA